MTTFAHQAADWIQKRVSHFHPKIGIILGSGAGELANRIDNRTSIPYSELSGFHTTTVSGHAGILHLGNLGGVPVACYQGRAHYYEGINPVVIKTMVRTLKLIGCETLLITNAAAAINKKISTGDLALITDHINFQFNNVLVGPNEEDFGPRFISMQEVYDPTLQKQFLRAAKALNIKLKSGVYVGVLGPAYETPAEINAFRILGADLVGMSTIAEATVARHCNMRVAAISIITNMASGLAKTKITHEEVLEAGQKATKKLSDLLTQFVSQYES